MFKYKFYLVCLFCLYSTIACAEGIVIDQARIPTAPPSASVMAAYLSITNKTKESIRISHFSSSAFKKIEVHLSSIDARGIARMRQAAKLVINSSKTLEMKSGSYHLMLFEPLQKIKINDKIPFKLILKSKKEIKFEASVVESTNAINHKHHH